ncbi:DUF6214 family protein [Streptomyces incarnatus]|uniref:DUF6214 family protein n=1 Tax=Streptomyces incarnatus TaxID=665007 RepID=UPI003CC5FA55
MWPAWKVREQGDATSWFYVRLAFPDGARVDALAVVREDCVSIEDVTAEPALSLADLTVLADWIQGPLFEACGVTAERPYEGEGEGDVRPEARHEPEIAGQDEREAEKPGEADPAAEERTERPTEEAGDESAGDHKARDDKAGDEKARDHKDRDEKAGDEKARDEKAGDVSASVFCVGPRRARAVWPRGIEGRRLVAQEYRAAQEEGADPVLAVMSATGHSRRRALRLIAQARDAGFLTPRHVRRD